MPLKNSGFESSKHPFSAATSSCTHVASAARKNQKNPKKICHLLSVSLLLQIRKKKSIYHN